MEQIEFNYKKPETIFDLILEELGEVTCERATTIHRVLWQYKFTLKQINEALETLKSQGKVRKAHGDFYKIDPPWVRCC